MEAAATACLAARSKSSRRREEAEEPRRFSGIPPPYVGGYHAGRIYLTSCQALRDPGLDQLPFRLPLPVSFEQLQASTIILDIHSQLWFRKSMVSAEVATVASARNPAHSSLAWRDLGKEHTRENVAGYEVRAARQRWVKDGALREWRCVR